MHLVKVFCSQKDNIRNQRENVILIIANAQSRVGIPAESDPVSNIFIQSSDLELYNEFAYSVPLL